MGYYVIKVDTQELESCAKKIDSFTRTYDNKMNTITGAVTDAVAYWQGEEYNAFRAKWDGMKAGGSVSGKTKQAMKNYAEYIRYAKKLYETAQENAKRRARGL